MVVWYQRSFCCQIDGLIDEWLDGWMMGRWMDGGGIDRWIDGR